MMVYTDVVQRVRITYSVTEPICYISVLDMGKLWHRLLRRADMPLAYSQGFNPQPRMQFASPLPVGYRSEAEVIDIYLGARIATDGLQSQLSAQCPRGLAVVEIKEVDMAGPTLQALMRRAEYRVELWSASSPEDIERSLRALMARDSVPRQRQRKGRVQTYDLRQLVHDLRYVGLAPDREGDVPCHLIHAETRCGSQGSGRPEEIIEELSIEAWHHRIWRTRLIWANDQEESQ